MGGDWDDWGDGKEGEGISSGLTELVSACFATASHPICSSRGTRSRLVIRGGSHYFHFAPEQRRSSLLLGEAPSTAWPSMAMARPIL